MKRDGGRLHVTSGVHGEVRNVRFKTWKGRPNLLGALKDVLFTSEVSEAEIRNVAVTIGEREQPHRTSISPS